MADEIPDVPPSLLDYRQPEPTKPGAATVGVMSGLLAGIAVVCGIGVVAFFPANPNFPGPGSKSQTGLGRALGIGFVGVAVIALVLAVRMWRVRPRSRWFLMGLLLGGGLMCLVEGACFSFP
ncbi:MAG TPA: DUF202 domain-containing protein [Tepidisphaeraceae bacterium]|jgi:drug/metabolite transporter (DMT)-like permease